MRIDIMVDIETLGKSDNTTVIQIGACCFNIETGEIYGEFNELADISKIKDMPVDGDTMCWWMKNKDTLEKILKSGCDNQLTQKDMFERFAYWVDKLIHSVGKENVFLWGNGILFDNRLIKSKMEQYGITYPIFYRNDRDMRTIVELAALRTGCKSENEFKSIHYDPSLTAHDGFDDCKNQINILSKAWNICLK